MSETAGPPAGARDLRLDFFRGLALFCIFIDHIPNNFFSLFTVQTIALSDAAELFILISGYTAGLVFGRIYDTRGAIASTSRTYHRVWQLYVAHIFLFMLYMGMMAHTMGTMNNPIYAEELGAADFLREPDVAVVMAMTLMFQPAFLDILPLYITLLLALPVMLALFRAVGVAALAMSFALWLAVQFDNSIALQSYPGPSTWYFNPFAWQFLFFIGAYFGWRGTPDDRWPVDRRLIWLAGAIAVFAFVLQLSWAAHRLYEPLPPLLFGPVMAILNKTDQSLPRLLNMLALAILVMRFIGPRDGWLAGRIAAPFILCGRHSLHIFCLGILLSVLSHLILNEFFGGILMQATVSIGGIVIMISVAGLMDWFRRSQAATSVPSRAKKAVAALALIASFAALGAAPANAAQTECPVPPDAFDFKPYVTKTVRSLLAGRTVTIIAIGGASTEGSAAGGRSSSWPFHLETILHARFPQSRVGVLNLGASRQTTRQMAKRIDTEILPLRPSLVIWETGTTEAVRGIDPAEVRWLIEDKVTALREAGIEVVLMDMQYSQRTNAVINLDRYVEMMRDAAEAAEVPLFPRYELMRVWAEMGLLDEPERTADARRALANSLYRCLASAVTEFIIRQPDPPNQPK